MVSEEFKKSKKEFKTALENLIKELDSTEKADGTYNKAANTRVRTQISLVTKLGKEHRKFSLAESHK